MADETNQNQAGEVAPTTDQPVATDLPTANKPDSKATAVPPKREKPPAKAAGEKPAAKADGEEKPAAKAAAAKKEKAPAVEDKPFVEFIEQHYLPAVQTAITQQGVADLQLSFAKQKVPISGFESAEDCYQLVGSWQNGLRQFNLYFPDEDIQGKKGFSCNEGKKPSTLESFLIDERKITLDLLVFGLVQRLNGQKWLGRN
ncbi:DUF2996 domain-containing protein [Calothrix membranacea FACHB-236]|nr:DUF2996 domain-containing protein [Calothrix membranacea FACHB-236]